MLIILKSLVPVLMTIGAIYYGLKNKHRISRILITVSILWSLAILYF